LHSFMSSFMRCMPSSSCRNTKNTISTSAEQPGQWCWLGMQASQQVRCRVGIAPWHEPTCFSVASASRPRWIGPSYIFLKVLSVPSRLGHARSNTAWNSDRSFWMGVPAADTHKLSSPRNRLKSPTARMHDAAVRKHDNVQCSAAGCIRT
jgi:hypothetical protein